MPDQKINAKKWVAIFGAMLGAFIAVLDIQITNSSLRDVAGGISATRDDGSWISTADLIGEIIAIPLTVWLLRFLTALPDKLKSLEQAMFGMTAALGPTIGDWLTDRFGWEWNFYLSGAH